MLEITFKRYEDFLKDFVIQEKDPFPWDSKSNKNMFPSYPVYLLNCTSLSPQVTASEVDVPQSRSISSNNLCLGETKTLLEAHKCL